MGGRNGWIFGAGWVAPAKERAVLVDSFGLDIDLPLEAQRARKGESLVSIRLGLAAVARSLRATDPSERENDHAVLFRDEELEARTIHRELPQEQPNREEWAVVRWQAVTGKRQRTHLHDGAHTAVPLQRAEVALRAVTGGWQREVDVLRAVRLVGRVHALLGGNRSCLRLDEDLIVQRPLVRLCGNAACSVNTVRFALPSALGQG